jgi:hypothetical protein
VTEELIPMQVEREPLEELADVEDPIAAPFKHFHAVVEPIHKAARLPTQEVVCDLIHPPIDRPQNALELGQPTLTHPLAPGSDGTLGPRLRIVPFKQVCQVFPQVVSRFDLRCIGEEPLEQFSLLHTRPWARFA